MANINVFLPPGATSDVHAPYEAYNVSNRLSEKNPVDKRIQEKRLHDKMRQ